jgi:hypothetical protein
VVDYFDVFLEILKILGFLKKSSGKFLAILVQKEIPDHPEPNQSKTKPKIMKKEP